MDRTFSCLACLLLLLAIAAGCATGSSPEAVSSQESALRDLVAAERAFARASEQAGVKQAFLTYLHEEGVIFRPGPVNGREFMAAQPEREGTLSWAPRFAEVAASGDFGYTTGPWTFTSPDASRPPAHGYYLSVWQRGPHSPWRVMLDIGTVNPPPPAPIAEWSERQPRLPAWGGGVPSEELLGAQRKALGEREKDLSTSPTGRTAVERFFTIDAVALRHGRQPAVGRSAVAEVLASEPEGVTWELEALDVASSADLAYTRGSYALPEVGTEGHFLRIWRRHPDGHWQVAVELLSPLPPPPPAS